MDIRYLNKLLTLNHLENKEIEITKFKLSNKIIHLPKISFTNLSLTEV